jgi:hypothetical protein
MKYHINPQRFHEQAIVITTGTGYNDNEMNGSDHHPLLINFETLDRKIGQGNTQFWQGFVDSIADTYHTTVKTRTEKELWPWQKKAVAAAIEFLDAP